MTQLVSPSAAVTAHPTRAPWTVTVLTTITLPLAVVTSYGAIYFSFFFENPDPGLGSWVFVTAFLAINAVAAVSAVAMFRGSRAGWQVLLGYGALGIVWCGVKLVFWQETESLVFGASNVVMRLLSAAPRTRRYGG